MLVELNGSGWLLPFVVTLIHVSGALEPVDSNPNRDESARNPHVPSAYQGTVPSFVCYTHYTTIPWQGDRRFQ